MHLLLKVFDIKRPEIAHHKVDEGREDIEFDQTRVTLRHVYSRGHEVGQADHENQRGVLEQNNRLRQQDRQHVAERLRQHDVAHGLRIAQAQRVTGPRLPARNAKDTRAHDLTVVGRFEQNEADQRGLKSVHLLLNHDRHQEIKPEDHEQQWQGTEEVDPDRADPLKQLDTREPHEGQNGAENDTAEGREAGQQKAELHAFPKIRQVAPNYAEIKSSQHHVFPCTPYPGMRALASTRSVMNTTTMVITR